MKTIATHIREMKALHSYISSGVWRDIIAKPGRKFVKICSILANGQISALQFIDPVTGNIYRANSWTQRGRKIGQLK